jgi:hypothetical protein
MNRSITMNRVGMFATCFVALAVVGMSCGTASADLIASWNFNDLVASTGSGATQTPPSNQGQTSYAPATGMGTLNLTGWQVDNVGDVWGITNFGGTLTNAVGVTPAGQALALQGGIISGSTNVVNNGAMMILSFNLLNHVDPILSFASQRTSTGFGPSTGPNSVSYSTDNSTYTPFATYSPVSSFTSPNGLHTFDFTAINALDHASTVYLKLTFNGATNGSGNNRLDNIQLNATSSPIPLPAAAFVFVGVAGAAGVARRRFKSLLS